MAIADASGYGGARFHLIGHDWGGSIAWSLADRYPQRIASLAVLSRPHPNAFNRALQMPDGDQARRSKHHKAFLEPDAADVVLADNAEGTIDFVVAPYRFEVLPGVGHFAADQSPDRVNDLLLQHIAAHPV